MKKTEYKKHYPKKKYLAVFVPPNIECQLTAVVNAFQDHEGRITLTYYDQTQETTPPNQPPLLVDDGLNEQAFESFFRIVDYVQGFRDIETQGV